MLALAAAVVLGTLPGCGELRGRRKIQQGNAAYKQGRFALAVQRFSEAEAFVPKMPLLWLNKGYACRELIVPGSESRQAREAAACALAAFERLRALDPGDPRGDRLYVQTLFDVGDLHTLERMFELRHQQRPNDLDVMLVLEQVYTRMGRWRDALGLFRKVVALRPSDAEAHYAVGTFISQLLSRSPSAPGGADRVELADEGVRHLERAAALRPRHPSTSAYLARVREQRSLALALAGNP
jgi:tetratricopeptide (TPR) repeat protein